MGVKSGRNALKNPTIFQAGIYNILIAAKQEKI
jgi:hypothetical protein